LGSTMALILLTKRETEMKQRILLLLKEKSTYSGLIAFLAGASVFGLGEAEWQAVAGAIASIAGLVTMLTLEKGDVEKIKEAE